jgi:hypothetical protein
MRAQHTHDYTPAASAHGMKSSEKSMMHIRHSSGAETARTDPSRHFLGARTGHPFNQIVTTTDVHATFEARHIAAKHLYFDTPVWLRILYEGHCKASDLKVLTWQLG